MPQFDIVTFFNQIFWFVFAFLSFYFVLLKGLLPVLAASLKTRRKFVSLIFSSKNAGLDSSLKKSYFKNIGVFLKSYSTLSSHSAQKKISLFDVHRGKIVLRSIFS